MEEKTKEWIEIITWFVLPVVFSAAVAYFEFINNDIVVSGLFALLAIALIIRRVLVERSEIEPIEKADAKIKKG